MTKEKKPFTFAISLSVLDHLGRKLYRNFSTVLGEAISNSWDAGANNVWIHIDKDKNNFYVKDDGEGMTSDDFQNKFLKVGYSKRQDGTGISPKTGRPYIGRKGIGKLALLSCANRIHVMSKVKGGEYVGGVVDNNELDRAITEDIIPQDYPLGAVNPYIFRNTTRNHEKGTILYFEDVKDGIKNSLDFLRKTIALYFRFSLHDPNFNIFLEDNKITFNDLDALANKTQFLWKVGNIEDPYINNLSKLSNVIKEKKYSIGKNIGGFIASVIQPKNLTITGADGRVGVDLFVNGRLREKDILKHMPTASIIEDYLYGQIHFDDLDKGVDRFTSSREGVIADDELYQAFLDDLKLILKLIFKDWDIWRIEQRNDGDPDNKRITKKERTSMSLFNAVSEGYDEPYDTGSGSGESKDEDEHKKKIDKWIVELGDDAKYNFESYAECFISENLVRKHIKEKGIKLTKEAEAEISLRKDNEIKSKGKGNLSIDIRNKSNDTNYLSMDFLSNMVDKRDAAKEACLSRDANEYKPIRDALMHTSILTKEAKNKLTTVKENIKGRVKTLLFEKKD